MTFSGTISRFRDLIGSKRFSDMVYRLVFFLVLYLFVLTPYSVLSFEDGTCFGSDCLALFPQSAGGLESNGPLRPEECTEKCADSEMPYAAIVEKKICLCAPLDRGRALESETRQNETLCEEGVEGYFRAYKSHIKRAVQGLNVTAPDLAYIDDNVTFAISLDEGVDVEFMVDFGDNTRRTEWDPTPKVVHVYRGSGMFDVVVFARQTSKPNRRVKVANHLMRVVDNLGEGDFVLTCFPIIEPDEDSGCNATALAGQSIHAKVDFNDTVNSIWEFDFPGK